MYFCFLWQGDPACLPQIDCTTCKERHSCQPDLSTQNAENSGLPRSYISTNSESIPSQSENFSVFCFLGCKGAFPQINCFQTRSNCNRGRRETFLESKLIYFKSHLTQINCFQPRLTAATGRRKRYIVRLGKCRKCQL